MRKSIVRSLLVGGAFQLHVAVGFHTTSMSSPPSISATSRRSSALFDKPVPFYLWDGATAQEKEIAYGILQRTMESDIHFQHEEHGFLANEEEEWELHHSDTFDGDALHRVVERATVPFYIWNQDSEYHLVEEEHSPDCIGEDKDRQQLHQKSSLADTPVLHEISREKKQSFRKRTADEMLSHKYENPVATGETVAAMERNRKIPAETLAKLAENLPHLLPLAHDQATEIISQTTSVRREDFQKIEIFLQALGDAARDGAASVLQDMGRGLRWNAVVTMAKSLSDDEKDRLLNILQESLDQPRSNKQFGVLEPNENERVSERKLQKEIFVLKELLEKRTQRNKELIVRENDLKLRLERVDEQKKNRMSSTGKALLFQNELIANEHLMQWELHLHSNKFSSNNHYNFDI